MILRASRFDSEGKEFSSVTGDHDFHFRKMNPSWGLFLQPDTLIPNVYDPQSLNRYMFERGNPYKNVDKDGHIGVVAAAAIFIVAVAVIEAGYEAINQYATTGEIYSVGRIGKAFGTGLLSGGMAVAGIFLAATGNEAGAIALEGISLKLTVDSLMESDMAAKKYLAEKEALEQLQNPQSQVQANQAQGMQKSQIPGFQGGQLSIPSSPTYGVSASGAHYGSPNKDVRTATGQAAAAARRAAESAS